MEIDSFGITGIFVVTPHQIGDERGYFAETFRLDRFIDACGDWIFVQDNESRSAKIGTVRGLHFQCEPYAQGKLVRCIAGALFDVAVDIRRGSPTFGQWVSETLTPDNGKQLWVPPGFAHGFCTLEPNTTVCYKVTSYYNADCDKGIAWDDTSIGVSWPPVADPQTLSEKDRMQPRLVELPEYFLWSN